MPGSDDNVVELLQAQNDALQARNEALQAKNEALELRCKMQRMEEREKINNRADWNKRSNTPWKKAIVKDYLGAGFTISETAGLFGVSEQTIKAYAPKDKPKPTA